MKPAVLPTLFLVVLAACGTTEPAGDKEPDLVFPIDTGLADTIVLEAMRPEFEPGAVERVTAPHMGYRGVRVGTEGSITISAYRIQAKAQLRDGSTIPGFVFEVADQSGSDAGAPVVERIRNRIFAAARREAGALPRAP